MDAFSLVRPEHLSHQGYLFGGQMLKWVDEYAWIAASRDFPGCTLVTRGLDRIDFHKRVHDGDIMRFNVAQARRGGSSVTYDVSVFAARAESVDREELVFSTRITFVAVDDDGNKSPLPPCASRS